MPTWPSTLRTDFAADRAARQLEVRALRDRDYFFVQAPWTMKIDAAYDSGGASTWTKVYDFPGGIFMPGWVEGDLTGWRIATYLKAYVSGGDAEWRLNHFAGDAYSTTITVSNTTPAIWTGPAYTLVSDINSAGRGEFSSWDLEAQSSGSDTIYFPAQADLTWRWERI